MLHREGKSPHLWRRDIQSSGHPCHGREGGAESRRTQLRERRNPWFISRVPGLQHRSGQPQNCPDGNKMPVAPLPAASRHSKPPNRPSADETRLFPDLEIGALARVMNNVEQKFVSRRCEGISSSTASGALRSGLVAPKALSRMRCLATNDDRSQVLAVRWISGVRRNAGGS